MTVHDKLVELAERIDRVGDDVGLTELLAEAGLGTVADDLAGAWKALTAPVAELDIDQDAGTVRIVIEPGLFPDLNDLAGYVPGVDLVGQFPTGDDFPSFQTGLDLRRVRIEADYRQPALTGLGLVVGPGDTSSWTVLDDLIAFTALEASITVADPLAGPSAEATVVVDATAEIAGGAVDATIELPSRSFTVALADGDQIPIDDLVAELLGLGVPLPDLACESLTIIGDPEAGAFNVDAGLAADWVIVQQPKLAIDEVVLDLDIVPVVDGGPTGVTGPDRSIESTFLGGLTLSDTLSFEVETEQSDDGWIFRGSLSEPLDVGSFLADLATAFRLPADVFDAVRELVTVEITELSVEVQALTGDVVFRGVSGIGVNGRAVELGLVIELVHLDEQGYSVEIGGSLQIDERVLEVDFTRTVSGAGPDQVTTTGLLAQYQDPNGTDMNVVTTVADLVPGANVGSEMDLAEVDLYHLLVGFRQRVEGADDPVRTFLFAAEVHWEPTIEWPALTSLLGSVEPSIEATVELEKTIGSRTNSEDGRDDSPLTGEVWGTFNPGIAGLDFLSLRLGYLLGPPAGFAIELHLGQVVFQAFEETGGDDDDGASLTFKVDGAGGLTIGDIVSFVASLLDPSIDELSFDGPWTLLTDFDLGDLLDDIVLTVAWSDTARSVSFVLPDLGFDGSDLGLPEDLLGITKLELGFKQIKLPNGGWKRSTGMSFVGTILGEDVTPNWDPVNESPPELPGQAPIVDLRYLAIGHHVAIQGAAEAASISEVMAALRGAGDDRRAAIEAGRPDAGDPLSAFGEGSGVSFSAESEWLIGLDIGLLRIVQLQVIFNDPIVYGLRIELDGEGAKNFAGLQFEILYQRINDTVGRYHAELVLPDIMRFIQLGAVSITLPIVVVDIYTNGDFKIDLGFPWKGDFSRSAAAEVFPFVGAGGFYLNKLSALTATDSSVPATTSGVFTPIYEFGLGLKVGLGKSFRSGPLRAEVSITVEGIVEGVVSWFEPRPQLGSGSSTVEPVDDRELYYRVAGAVSIVGRVYGEVDFVIIKVRVEVVARATIAFAVEPYKPILVALSAKVSVAASVEFLFITVDFSFELEVKQGFEIPSPDTGPAPWLDA